MNNYELCVIFRPELTEVELKEKYDVVIALIEDEGGKVDKVDDWGKRRLAYEIRKPNLRFNEGYYYFISYFSESKVPVETEKSLRINESIIRYLSIKKDA